MSVHVLKAKCETDSKTETRKKAGRIQKRIQMQESMMINVSMIEIYKELGETRKALGKVEQFPWTIRRLKRK